MTTCLTVALPLRFYDDHAGRDLPSGVVVRRSKTRVLVDLDCESFDDLLEDAEHYASKEMEGEFRASGYGGLVSSARATVTALQKAKESA